MFISTERDWAKSQKKTQFSSVSFLHQVLQQHCLMLLHLFSDRPKLAKSSNSRVLSKIKLVPTQGNIRISCTKFWQWERHSEGWSIFWVRVFSILWNFNGPNPQHTVSIRTGHFQQNLAFGFYDQDFNEQISVCQNFFINNRINCNPFIKNLHTENDKMHDVLIFLEI